MDTVVCFSLQWYSWPISLQTKVCEVQQVLSTAAQQNKAERLQMLALAVVSLIN